MTDRLTVVHVSTALHNYGGENQVFLLADGLRRQGHRCILFGRAHGEVLPRFQQAGFETFGFAGRGRSPRTLWQIRREVRRLNADVVHAHDAHAVFCGGLGLMQAHCVRIATRRCVYPLNSTWKYRYGCDRLIAISQATIDSCLGSGFPADRIELIPSGVSPDRIESGDRQRGRVSLGAAPEELVAVQVGSLLEAKGHIDLLQALVQLGDEQPRLRVYLAGEGELHSQLVQFVEEHGLRDRVRFLGYRQDVPDLLAAADLVLMPSRSESLGTSAIDAMLAERPLITSTAGGLPELVGPTAAEPAVAEMVPPAAPAELAAAIRLTLENLPAARQRSALARQRALREFSSTQMVAANLRVYQDCLEVRQASRRAG